MITVIIILSIILLIPALLLTFPVHIVADTPKKIVMVSSPVLFKALLKWDDGRPVFTLRIFFIRFTPEIKRQPKAEITPTKKGRSSFRADLMPQYMHELKKWGNSFRIKKLMADIDTGDFPLNAELIPVTTLLNGPKTNIRINFEDSNFLVMHIQNRIYHYVRLIVRLYLINRKNK